MRRARTEHERSRRRLLGALFTALLAHVLLVFLAYRLAETPPHHEALIVELRTVPPRAPPSPPVPPSSAGHPATRKPAPHAAASLRPDLRTSPDAGGRGSGTGGVAPLTPAPAPPAPPVAATPPPTPGDVKSDSPSVNLMPIPQLLAGNQRWRAQHGDGDGNGLGGESPGGIGMDDGTGRGSGEGDGEGPEAERARVSGRIARDLADAQARDRVDVGLVDPYFRVLKDGMKDGWHPRASTLDGDDGDGKIAGMKNMLKQWNNAGKQFAQTGSPYAPGEKPSGPLPHHEEQRAQNGGSGFDPADFMHRWNSGEFGNSDRVVVVELTQRPDGEPLTVKVVESSGGRAFDQEAMEAVKGVAREHLAPKHGLGLGGPLIRSRWKMEARLVVNTVGAVPDLAGSNGTGFLPGFQMGGTFDETTGKVDPEIPLTTKIVTKITLLAIYGGETGPHPQ